MNEMSREYELWEYINETFIYVIFLIAVPTLVLKQNIKAYGLVVI